MLLVVFKACPDFTNYGNLVYVFCSLSSNTDLSAVSLLLSSSSTSLTAPKLTFLPDRWGNYAFPPAVLPLARELVSVAKDPTVWGLIMDPSVNLRVEADLIFDLGSLSSTDWVVMKSPIRVRFSPCVLSSSNLYPLAYFFRSSIYFCMGPFISFIYVYKC